MYRRASPIRFLVVLALGVAVSFGGLPSAAVAADAPTPLTLPELDVGHQAFSDGTTHEVTLPWSAERVEFDSSGPTMFAMTGAGVAIFDLETLSTSNEWVTSDRPIDIDLDADARRLYVLTDAREVHVLSTPDLTSIDTIALPDGVGNYSVDALVNTSAGLVVMTSLGMLRYDPLTHDLETELDVTIYSSDAIVEGPESFVFILDVDEFVLYKFDVASTPMKLVASTTSLSGVGTQLVLSQDKTRLYSSGAVIDTGDLTIVATHDVWRAAEGETGEGTHFGVHFDGQIPRLLEYADSNEALVGYRLLGCASAYGGDVIASLVLPSTALLVRSDSICSTPMPPSTPSYFSGTITRHDHTTDGLCAVAYEVGLLPDGLPRIAASTFAEFGTFALPVREGRYSVMGWDCTRAESGPSFAVAIGPANSSQAFHWVVTELKHVPVSIELRAAGAFSGRVTDEAGAPLANVDAFAVTSVGYRAPWFSRTDADGNFWIPGLSEFEEYSVVFDDSEGRHKLEYFDNVDTLSDAFFIEPEFGVVYTGWDAVLAPGVPRIQGADRYETASQIAFRGFSPGTLDVVFIATGSDYPDALAGGALAGATGAPVLLTLTDGIPASTRYELDWLKPKSIVILGGSAVVSESVRGQLAEYTEGSVTRLAGSDRFGTAAAISMAGFVPGVDTVYLATGANFPDALAGGAVAAATGSPILLTSHGALPFATSKELARLKPDRIVILGGTAAVSEQVEMLVSSYAPVVERLFGADRYSTAEAISKSGFTPGVDTVLIATGTNFPDALAGGPLAVVAGGPILLVSPDSIPAATSRELARLKPQQIFILGGEGAVSDEVSAGLAQFVHP